MTATAHRSRAVLAGAIAALILLAGFAAGWVGKIAADDRAEQATTAAKAVADPIVKTCEKNTAAGVQLRADGACPVARQVQKAVEDEREPVLVPVPGPQGPQGLRGFIGPVGPTGDPGKEGKPGANGANGENGSDGTDGTDGLSGTNGEPGSDGSDGPPGSNGADGQNGADGTDGQPGPPGADGQDGADGIDGEPGPPGPAGPAGPTGAPGVVNTAVSPSCTEPAPLALTTSELLYDPATQTITLVCNRR